MAAVGSDYTIVKGHVFVGQGEVAFSKTYALACSSFITCFAFCGHDPVSKWSFVAHIQGCSLTGRNPQETTDRIRDTILSLGLQLQNFRCTLSGGILFEKQNPAMQKFLASGKLDENTLLLWKNTMLEILALTGFTYKTSRFLTLNGEKIPGLVLNPSVGKLQFMKKPWEALDDYSEKRFDAWYLRHGMQIAFGVNVPMTLMIVTKEIEDEKKAAN